MAQIYRPAPRRKTTQQQWLRDAKVVGLDHQGRGVIRTSKGVRFVAGALPEEVVDVVPKGKWDAELRTLKTTSEQRCQADCRYYERCGGCDLQHLHLAAQRQHKQQVVSELFAKFAEHEISTWLPPLTAAAWRYRRRLRLACHWDAKRKKLKLGLRQANSKTIVEINDCLVTQTSLTQLFAPLRELLPQLNLVNQLGHVELLSSTTNCVILRVKSWPNKDDSQQLKAFADRHNVDVWLHSDDGPPRPLNKQQELPKYRSWQSELAFQPGDFLQAHAELSEAMVAQAVAWLAPQRDEKILELYAGSGNFSLPIALQGAQVTAIEGVASMVDRLRYNAQQYALTIDARQADLEQNWQAYEWAQTRYQKVFLDPARAGAANAIKEVAQRRPQRIVYVSCAPDTLARDAKQLFNAGYRLVQAQIVDMFPQTHHIECLTWFEREA
ncbi:23S rRNA (uracil(1939)-C(5))-methyltransferase RlmD [Pseudidiomarina piscicola]|uniref:23S rRNA (Uracil(1939)-C(5))-methyltransferase RlmD n=1 Tax=Pseudidiomarina piscicola TaxID=2614830 RepID=A0A6Z0BWV5_9GAMM|nr:RsmD family RNA methyltransferase [Pseudidiomarina piscicola]CAB0149851.1 23S rRNA (uracil(1939)-C(5))-methyltransferase RlmD [Pseudidiomarina piscicola]VZT39299.1 23S rRNA (uracil(1939)-C(5))-methyltransferase RlmD [Pseudomonas aeruginosa]